MASFIGLNLHGCIYSVRSDSLEPSVFLKIPRASNCGAIKKKRTRRTKEVKKKYITIRMRPFETMTLVFLACVLHKTFGHDRENVGMGPLKGMKLLSRSSRTLLFPEASTTALLLILGIGTPLQLDRESVIIGAFTKFLYTLPQNSTDFTEPGVQLKSNSRSRWSIYKILEKASNLYGFGGKACLLKAICEVAAAPFDLRHGLFGQIIQTFFTVLVSILKLLTWFLCLV